MQRTRKPSPIRSVPLFLLLALLLPALATGCQSLFDSEAADAKWKDDYARCRFGKTPEQLDQHNENPEAAGLPQSPGWRACLTEAGWQTDPSSTLGPRWDD